MWARCPKQGTADKWREGGGRADYLVGVAMSLFGKWADVQLPDTAH